MANPSGFSNLLRSQIPVDLDSPEPFWFGSQVPDESPSQVPEESGVKERRKYSPREDKILIGAWLNTSKDPVVGNEQKAGAFWKQDLQRLLDIGESRGFPGMVRSIDCMHWEWKNCPIAWKGQYGRGSGKPTIVLEAVATHDLWIWHAFFGPPGTLYDINVLDRSPVFDDILEGRTPRLFAKVQEATRKDVERAFGVLQSRFAIVRNPVLSMNKAKIGKIMRTCIILHNMIVENERDGYIRYDISEFEEGDVTRSSEVETEMPRNLNNMFPNRNDLRDRHMHERLKNDLIENIWNKFGDED
uniref:DDE Tnp4 domain-containing protein n=1 Tax=Brassica oleracea var. oleracea TaxID=109376 RepID=A0A0D3CWV2_BRAOL